MNCSIAWRYLRALRHLAGLISALRTHGTWTCWTPGPALKFLGQPARQGLRVTALGFAVMGFNGLSPVQKLGVEQIPPARLTITPLGRTSAPLAGAETWPAFRFPDGSQREVDDACYGEVCATTSIRSP